jgi:hypothetical protein
MQRRFFLLAPLLLSVSGSTLAQTLPQGLQIALPQDRPYGPHESMVTFKVTNTGDRVLFSRTPVTLRLVTEGGEIFQEEPITRLPFSLPLDAAKIPTGKYRLELWTTVERQQHRLDQTPLVQIGKPAPPPPPPVVLKPHFAERPNAIKGEFNTNIADWPEDVSSSILPMVRVIHEGKVRNLIGTGGSAPYVLHFDARPYPAGKYTLELVAMDTDSAKEVVHDTLEIEIERAPERIAARAPQAQNLSAPQVAVISRELGDPHPFIAAAQWALESAWGQRPCARYNYFGIKARDDQPGAEKETKEFENGEWITIRARFAHFASASDGIKARLTFLQKSRYASYWNTKTDEDAARALQSAGYATDPNYATKLIRLAHQIAGMDTNIAPILPGASAARSLLSSRQSPPRMQRTAPPKKKGK